jgi:hypothetical protein
MIGGIIRCAFLADYATGAGTRSLPLPRLRQALGAGGPSSEPTQPSEFAGHLVCPLPYTDSSFFRMEILVLGNAGEIMERIASQRADATSIVFSKCRQKRKLF